MKINYWHNSALALFVSGVFSSAALAQDSSPPNPPPPPVASAPAPQLGYGALQILQLVRAKLTDDTVIAYIKNSGNSFALNADQIIYLRQQGVSDPVITTMLNQPRPGVAAAAPATSAPPPVYSGQDSPAPVAQTVTYVETLPAYYYQPYYYYPYSCSTYAWYPPLAFSFGWSGGWNGGWHGGGYVGGWRGGFHGGAGFRSGGHR